jgi:hypothetical protein
MTFTTSRGEAAREVASVKCFVVANMSFLVLSCTLIVSDLISISDTPNTDMLRLLLLLALGLGLGLGLGLKKHDKSDQGVYKHKGPNVLLIMTDDQGPFRHFSRLPIHANAIQTCS